MLYRDLDPIHATCGATDGCSAGAEHSRSSSRVLQLFKKLCCTVFTYRYHFFKEWYRTRRI
jgi:hypothetical protein